MKRLIRLAVFAIVAMIVVCGAVFGFGGFGRSRVATLPPTNPPHATAVAAEADPTIAPAPTVTTEQRSQLQTIATRAESMAQAAEDLQQLGQAIRADTVWRGKIKAATSVMLGGAKTIDAIELPDFLSPLAQRIAKTTAACGAPATTLNTNVTTIAVKDVADQDTAFKICARDMRRIVLSISGVE